jgi:hypothetical protein
MVRAVGAPSAALQHGAVGSQAHPLRALGVALLTSRRPPHKSGMKLCKDCRWLRRKPYWDLEFSECGHPAAEFSLVSPVTGAAKKITGGVTDSAPTTPNAAPMPSCGSRRTAVSSRRQGSCDAARLAAASEAPSIWIGHAGLVVRRLYVDLAAHGARGERGVRAPRHDPARDRVRYVNAIGAALWAAPHAARCRHQHWPHGPGQQPSRRKRRRQFLPRRWQHQQLRPRQQQFVLLRSR